MLLTFLNIFQLPTCTPILTRIFFQMHWPCLPLIPSRHINCPYSPRQSRGGETSAHGRPVSLPFALNFCPSLSGLPWWYLSPHCQTCATCLHVLFSSTLTFPLRKLKIGCSHSYWTDSNSKLSHWVLSVIIRSVAQTVFPAHACIPIVMKFQAKGMNL